MADAIRYPQSNLAACLLPWTDDFALDEPAFERHVQAVIDGGYTSLYVMGTAGEGYALDEDLYRQVVALFANLTVRPGLDPQVGVMGTSMRQMINRLAFAYDQGVRMFQVSLPCWGALDDPELDAFFRTVCGQFPDARFLHYNLPRTKRVLTGADYRRLADQVPNLVATKNSNADYLRTADLLSQAPELQHFLLETNFAMGCTVGECSLLCSYSALFPRTTWRFFEAGQQRDLPELFRLTRLLNEAGEKLVAHVQRPMIDGAFDKTFAWLRDPAFPTRLLPPYRGFTDEELRRCREVYEAHYAQVE